jgi:hypothetical protein
MTEEELARGNARFPTSNLMNIIGTDVSKGVEIRLGNFPDKWKHDPHGSQQAMGRPVSQLASGLSRQTTQAYGGGEYPGGTPSSFPPLPVKSQGMERPVTIQQDDVHPMIRSMMADYVRHFCSVQFRSLCQAAGITETGLPNGIKVCEKWKEYAMLLLCTQEVQRQILREGT